MINGTVVSHSHTKQHHIPLGHIEHRYIQNCTDEVELERIYQELIGGEIVRSPILEQLTLDRIRNIQTNSRVHGDETVHFIDSTSHLHHRRVPRSDEDWQKFERKLSQEFKSDNDDANSEQEELSKKKTYEHNKRLHMANQHRLNANTAFNSKNYQRSIDLYTKSLKLENHSIAYINRAIAHLRLDHFDESIEDCSEVLFTDSKHTKALFCRALSYFGKKQYKETKDDLNGILAIDPEDNEAQNLFNTITTLTKTAGIANHQLLSIAPLAVEEGKEEEEEEKVYPTTKLVHFERKPSPFDALLGLSSNHRNVNPFQTSSGNNDDADGEDDMLLGYEADVNSVGNLSDNEGQHVSHSINVSPTIDNDSDLPELLDQKPLQTPPMTPPIKTYQRQDFRSASNELDELTEIFHSPRNNPMPTKSNQFSTMSYNSSMDRRRNPSNKDSIADSNFSPIIQSWLQDLAVSDPYHRLYDRYPRPWAIEQLLKDVERFSNFNDFQNALEVSKKILHNGLLDYHCHAECITLILFTCGLNSMRLDDDTRSIQYTTEALQYDTKCVAALLCRAEAFRKKNMLFLSYGDYARILSHDDSNESIRHSYERVTSELNATEGETWREKLSTKQTADEEIYLIFLRTESNYCEENAFEWYQSHADQLYLDACFVLAIRLYTLCIELQPQTTSTYLKRAACYLKVYEPKKAIGDCDYVLKEDPRNLLALYRKACAYKLSRNEHLYESTLEEYLKIQPHNQIVLAEYHSCRREDIPRRKRRIRTPSDWDVKP